jgi:hypothetical protein
MRDCLLPKSERVSRLIRYALYSTESFAILKGISKKLLRGPVAL